MCPSKFAKLPLSKSKWKQKVRVIDDDDDVNNNIIVMVISVEYRSEAYLSALSIDIRQPGARWGKKEAFFPKNRPKNCTHILDSQSRGPPRLDRLLPRSVSAVQIAAKCCPISKPITIQPTDRPTDSCWMCHIV